MKRKKKKKVFNFKKKKKVPNSSLEQNKELFRNIENQVRYFIAIYFWKKKNQKVCNPQNKILFSFLNRFRIA